MTFSFDSVRDRIRRQSAKNSDVAQAMLRIFIMERFMERLSLSPYRENFILKGGLLVSTLVGVNLRSTMDIDTTIHALPLTPDNARRIMEEIAAIDLNDNVSFQVGKHTEIMHERDYHGIRLSMRATMGTTWQAFSIDLSTNEILTPHAIEYSMPLLLEKRTINVLAYNNETLLAEKVHTVIARGDDNTRMRDFYDIHTLTTSSLITIDYNLLPQAVHATMKHRGAEKELSHMETIIDRIANNTTMEKRWRDFARKNTYVSGVTWADALTSTKNLVHTITAQRE